jgi:ATP-dependent protease ClpP protease subunit
MHYVSGKRTYHLYGDINHDSMRIFSSWYREHVSEDSGSWLRLCITSGGGGIIPGFGVIDFVLSIQKTQIQTVALGDVSSMAIPLFLMGEQRIVSSRTTFLIHEMGRNFSKDCMYSTKEIRQMLQRLELQEKVYSEFVAKRSCGKLSSEECLKFMREETSLTAEDALRLGLAHEISTEV